MLDKLATIDSRYSELERLMADPEIAVDYSRVQELAREMASLKDVAALSRRYRKATQDADGAREIARDESDREMAALAREELSRSWRPRSRRWRTSSASRFCRGTPTTQRTSSWRYGRAPAARRPGCSRPTCTGCTPGTLSSGVGSSRSSTPMRTASAASRRSYSGSTARGPIAASSTRAACTGCRGYRSPSPPAGYTPPPRRLPCSRRPRRSTWRWTPKTCR